MASVGAPEARLRRIPLPSTGGLALIALVVTAMTLGATLAVAGDTLGYDFRAYHAAAARVLDGGPLYDLDYDVAGPYGLFLYPPPFLFLALPFGLLPVDAATAAWLAGLVLAFGAGVALLPVSPRVRWAIVLLAGLSWPFVYAMKLGQVGPLVFLAFAAGWRWMDRPAVLGTSAALGTVIKLQPAIVLAWALVTRRWWAVVAGAAVLAGLSAAVTLIVGLGAWGDFVTLIGRVSDPITTPHNFTLGAVLYQLGLAHDAAAALQLASSALAVLLCLLAALRGSAVASYLAVVTASQMLSPVAWDHYAMLLLVPVAWVLDRGWWWAAAIPLATSLLLFDVVPPLAYPVSFWVTLVALVVKGLREGRAARAVGPA